MCLAISIMIQAAAGALPSRTCIHQLINVSSVALGAASSLYWGALGTVPGPCPHRSSSTAIVRWHSTSSSTGFKQKHRIVFLGSPSFAATVLKDLFQASRKPGSCFEVIAVVSRGHEPQPRHSHGHQSLASQERDTPPPGQHNHPTHHLTPVAAEALSQGLLPHQVLCPTSAKEESFLRALSALRPDLAITAAYGCLLPQAFLDIPRLGTINIHPSLLPSFRGAAPVQRCLEAGHTVTGVSLVFTVLRCDAGPVLAKQELQVAPDIQAPELTHQLFDMGSRMLLHHLPHILSGQATHMAVPQDESRATHAAKVTKEEALLDLRLSATAIHDKVRALAGWPGTRASFLLQQKHSGQLIPIEVKIMRTRVITHASQLGVVAQQTRDAAGPAATQQQQSSARTTPAASVGCISKQDKVQASEGQLMLPGLLHLLPADRVSCVRDHMLIPCGDHTWLEVCEARFSGAVLHGSPRGPPLTGAQLMQGLGKRLLLLPHFYDRHHS